MSDKSFVTIEVLVCPVCGKEHESGALFLDRRLKDSFERKTTTGIEMCPEHAKLRDEGFAALIEAEDPEEGKEVLTLDEANRTGRLMHIKKSVAEEMFNQENTAFPDIAFINNELFEMLLSMSTSDEENTEL